MGRADGSIIIDTEIDTSGVYDGTVDIKRQFGSLSASAKQTANAINAAFSDGFSKPVENAKLKVESLESELESIAAKFKDAVADDDDKAAARLGAQQERVYDRLVAARKKLELEVEAAAARQAEAEERAAQKTAQANEKASAAAQRVKDSTNQSAGSMSEMSKSATRFGRRLASIASGALFFNVVSAALSKLTSTLWDAISSTTQMQNAMANLKGAAYTAASPILNVLSSAFATLANTVAKALSYITQLYSLFSGKSLGAIASTAEQMGNVASAAGGAAQNAEKAKKSLAGFDEINTLADTSGGSSGGGGGTSSSNYDYNLDSEISPVLVTLSEKMKKLLTPLKEIDFAPLKKSLSGLSDAFKKLGGTIGKSLKWAWENILVPLAKWTIEKAVPKIVDLLASAFEFFSEVIEAFAPIAEAFWDNFLEPLAEWTGKIAIDAIELLADVFAAAAETMRDNSDDLSQHIIDNFNNTGTQVDANYIQPTKEDFANAAAWIKEKLAEAGDSIIQSFNNAGTQVDTNFIQPTREDMQNAAVFIQTAFQSAKDAVLKAWNGVSTWFQSNVIKPVSDKFSDLWGKVSSWAATAWSSITGVFSQLAGFFRTTFGAAWDAIVGVFTGETTFKDLTSALAESFRNIANGIIDGINGILTSVIGKINTMIINVKFTKILGKYPFGGLSTIPYFSIPYLAKGAVIPPNAPFMAVLGDQKRGTNIEAPLSTIQEAVAAVMADMVGSNVAGFEAIIERQERILAAIESIEIGDSTIGEAAARYQTRMAVARGG